MNTKGYWSNDMKIAFSRDEVDSILKEFVRVAYGIDEKDIGDVEFIDGDYNDNVIGFTNTEVTIATKNARPSGWTYRD